MPFAPPDRPSRFQLGPLRVGNPVSSYHGARVVNDLAELLAYNVQSHADCTFGYNYGGGAANVSVFWSRSPGCQALLVGAELQPSDSCNATLTVTNNGAALTWIQPNGLDGSLPVSAPPASTVVPQLFHGVVDASAFLTDGTVYRLNFAIATSTGALLERIFVREILSAQVAPEASPTTEVSANAAWPFYRPGGHGRPEGPVDGTSARAVGFVRLHDQLEQARTRWRDWRQWTFFELDAYAPQTTSGSIGALTFANGGAYTPQWYTRSRRLYGTTVGTATKETVQVVARYKCGGTGGTIRVKADGTNNDFAVAAAGAYTTASLGTMQLLTNGTNQRVKIELQGGVASTGTLIVPTLALYSLET